MGAGMGYISVMDIERSAQARIASSVDGFSTANFKSAVIYPLIISTRKTSGVGGLRVDHDEDSSVVFRTTSKSIRYFLDDWKH
jgi:hypothetical protein